MLTLRALFASSAHRLCKRANLCVRYAERCGIAKEPDASGVLLDADDDCPAELGPSLLKRCREATGLPVAVVGADREFHAR